MELPKDYMYDGTILKVVHTEGAHQRMYASLMSPIIPSREYVSHLPGEDSPRLHRHSLYGIEDRMLYKVIGDIPFEISNRHFHPTLEQYAALTGRDDFNPKRELSQPGQYLDHERVDVVGPGGVLHYVAILGPAREHGQLELLRHDVTAIGLAFGSVQARMSGDLIDTPGGVRIEGSNGAINLEDGIILAQRHAHISSETASLTGINDGDHLFAYVRTEEQSRMVPVEARVSEKFKDAVHVDKGECVIANGYTCVLYRL
ncbi:hypothetical protein H6504_02050 [Candidatus Woesearchaeota archaeon]|nr:hypothetical protein [Candidatus Woesearchaeota archaeon]